MNLVIKCRAIGYGKFPTEYYFTDYICYEREKLQEYCFENNFVKKQYFYIFDNIYEVNKIYKYYSIISIECCTKEKQEEYIKYDKLYKDLNYNLEQLCHDFEEYKIQHDVLCNLYLHKLQNLKNKMA